ncbi:P-loop containing nucleoside triphosphate hydrolase protein [Cytidiella melzeri]|nr:P-loop containing nucleoside triphosphate hydrolase protein [Cytidiella melzeri]
MPAKKGIVKSGNAGNSSKATIKGPELPSTEEKPLFPPGFKYPLSLLHERCQKNGWDKPNVETRRQSDGFSFTVFLNRTNKKNEKESVRLEPHPPFVLPTALEARHWGATYAMYRFCNGIQLNRVLPPGPREYWTQLAAEHKQTPEHQKWMYDADPFAARKAVDERQEKAAKKREQPSSSTGTGAAGPSPEFAHAPEVKMASSVRDVVEDSIKKAFELYPEATEATPTTLAEEHAPEVKQRLQVLGFTAAQARSATEALSRPSALSSILLSSLSPLDASLEFLLLHVPECDLPQRFMPTMNTSNPFISSTHSGTDDLKLRWIQEKLIRECGWPVYAVKDVLSDADVGQDWTRLVKSLNVRLVGDATVPVQTEVESEAIDEEELDALSATFVDERHMKLPLLTAPLCLHVLFASSDHILPSHGDPPAMYLTSGDAPAYVRLHMLSRLITAFRQGTLVEPGETTIMAVVRLLEEEWAFIQDNGPPDMSAVLKHLLSRKSASLTLDNTDDLDLEAPVSTTLRKPRRTRRDGRSDSQVKEDFDLTTKKPAYEKMLFARQKLPAFAAKDTFLATLEKNRCVVVVGETGCGKTTQLPQFILDSLIQVNRGASASIIITQPRRLSAIGVAARVSSERLDDDSVGYAIRGESKQSSLTKLLFCTTGVVLRRLGSGDKLTDVTHVIVDEVHERSVDGDILLLHLKELMVHHPTLKIVLMSATINHEIFIKYFNNAPLLTIPGMTHPVKDIYLEEVLPLISYRPSGPRSTKKTSAQDRQKVEEELAASGLDEKTKAAMHALAASDRIDFELITAVVKHIISSAPNPGGILIFLPGVQDIRSCIEALRGLGNAKIFPLHANLSSDEQRVVFDPTPGWKVIAATNVAETSITIDDIVYVIDSGKVKETQYDPENGLTRLVEQWVTRAAAKQRRGRAGRTKPGFCYKLYTRAQERKMAAFPIPEIKRIALESVSLTVKVMHDDVKKFLARAIDPPEMSAIDGALATLTELGAITEDGELTPMGQHLSTLPVDLRLGKMLIFATIFRCLGPILTVAACLSSKPLFVSPLDKREEASRARERFAVANSDLLTDVNAYEECRKLSSEKRSNLRAFCEENFLSQSTMRDITSLRTDFLSTLVSLNLVPQRSTPTSPSLNLNSSNTGLLKAVILAGLWPRVARVVLPPGAIKFDRVQAGTVQRANEAREFKFFDVRASDQGGGGGGSRVFLHPASVLFKAADWKVPFVAYFQKQMSSKVFLRDATEVPFYALLMFGGPVEVNHIGGGLTVGTKNALVKLKAWPRIGVLVKQLRQLLDIQLKRCVEEGGTLDFRADNPVILAVLALLQGDGLST